MGEDEVLKLGAMAMNIGVKLNAVKNSGIQGEIGFLIPTIKASDGAQHVTRMNECIKRHNELLKRVLSIRQVSEEKYEPLLKFSNLDTNENEEFFKMHINELYTFGSNYVWNDKYKLGEKRSQEILRKNWKAMVSLAIVVQRN